MITKTEVLEKIDELKEMVAILLNPQFNESTHFLWKEIYEDLTNIRKKIDK
jgi:hypothetical protein